MKVLVLGAGVVGVTSAYYLARAGHDVTVIERREQAGLETSFANAGQVSPGYSSPWAAPGIPVKALKWLLMKHRPLVIWPMPDPRDVALGDQHAGQLHIERLCAQQGAHGAAGRIQPRQPARPAPRDRHHL